MVRASPSLFIPQGGALRPGDPARAIDPCLMGQAEHLHAQMKRLVQTPGYPCVAAIAAMAREEYRLGIYAGFGQGDSSGSLAMDLHRFMAEQRASSSPYLSFWAVFPQWGPQAIDAMPVAMPDDGGDIEAEARFERDLWRELSHLAAAPGYERAWDPEFSADPSRRDFCFSFAGEAFFVVGLHAKSSRVSRRFEHPTLIFNVYRQFEQLMEAGRYDAMVAVNRQKDLTLQGSVNPMALRHGEAWEAIQFSGAARDDDWKCPFEHLARASAEAAG